MDDRQDMPANRIRNQQMREELSNDPETVVFVTVYGVIILRKIRFEKVHPETIQLAKSFSNQTIELFVSAFL